MKDLLETISLNQNRPCTLFALIHKLLMTWVLYLIEQSYLLEFSKQNLLFFTTNKTEISRENTYQMPKDINHIVTFVLDQFLCFLTIFRLNTDIKTCVVQYFKRSQQICDQESRCKVKAVRLIKFLPARRCQCVSLAFPIVNANLTMLCLLSSL